MPERTKPSIGVTIAGIEMKSPFVLASGTFGYGFEFSRVTDFSFGDIGAIILKSITLKPRTGNPPHRIAETPAGVLNSIGMQNPGVEYFAKTYLPQLADFPTNCIANIGGSSVEEYVRVAETLAASNTIKAIELNISCPNVKGGCAFGVNPDDAFAVTNGVKSVCDKPIIVKLTPSVTDIQTVAEACISARADAISVGNTYTGMAIDTRSRRPILGNNYGGLSGPAIRPLTVCNVHKVRQITAKHNIPIIAFGGVTNANDAVEVMLAGASAVGVGTAIFTNSHICTQLAAGLREYLKSQNESNVSDIVGSVRLNQTPTED